MSSSSISYAWRVGDLFWTLPGISKPLPVCGDRLDSGVPHKCNRLVCYNCFRRVQKAQSFRIYKSIEESDISKENIRHIILSPPQEWAQKRMKTLEGFRYLKRRASEVIRGARLEAGVWFFHAWRLTDDVKECFGWNYLFSFGSEIFTDNSFDNPDIDPIRKRFDRYNHHLSENTVVQKNDESLILEDRKRRYRLVNRDGKFSVYGKTEEKDIWKLLRKEGQLKLSDDILEISPHFHVLGSGFLERADKFNERTEWIYKNLGRPKYSIRNRAKYNLNHVGLILSENGDSRINSYSYVGKLAKRGGG